MRTEGIVGLATMLTACACSGGGEPIGLDERPPRAQLPDGGGSWPNAEFMPQPPAAPTLPTLPATPQEPELGTCPAGWAPDTSGSCAPWPGGEPPSGCAVDAAPFVGRHECVTVGGTCPANGEFPTGLPGSGVIYVSAAAGDDGEGTRASPFDDLESGLAAASPEDVVALSSGEYTAPVEVPDGVTLWGACPQDTVLRGTSIPDGRGIIHVTGADVVVRDVTITGDGVGAWVQGTGASLTLESVLVVAPAPAGIRVQSEEAFATALMIRGSRRVGDGGGFGVEVWDGGRLTLDTAVIEDSETAGLLATHGARVEVDRVLVHSTAGEEAEAGRFGLTVAGGATTTIRESVLRGHRDSAIFVTGESTLDADWLMTRGRPRSDGSSLGFGVVVFDGASAALHHTRIEAHGTAGTVVDAQAHLDMQDVSIAEVTESPDGFGGRGSVAQGGGTLVLERVVIRDTQEIGLFLGPGTDGELTDVTVDGVRPRSTEGRHATGIEVPPGATARLTRGRTADTGPNGLAVGGVLEAEDVTVERNRASPLEDRGGPTGVVITAGATAALTRLRVAESEGVGLTVAGPTPVPVLLRNVTVSDLEGIASPIAEVPEGAARCIQAQHGAEVDLQVLSASRCGEMAVVAAGATLRIADVTVTDQQGNPSRIDPNRPGSSELGFGLDFHGGATVDAHRLHVTSSRGAGILVSGQDTSVRIHDVTVRNTRASELGLFGRGITAQAGANLELERALLEGNREVSLAAFDPGTQLEGREVGLYESRTTCPDCAVRRGGTGAGAYREAQLSLRRFRIDRGALAAFQLAREGEGDLSYGVVRGFPIGANLQTSFDVERLTDRVLFVDNGRNLDATELPLPEPAATP